MAVVSRQWAQATTTVLVAFSFLLFNVAYCTSRSTIVHLCDDPSFDAAVAVSESQVLLFKNKTIWVLDLLNYQVNLAYSNLDRIDSCLNSSDDGILYVWSQHDNFMHMKNKICIERNDHLCQLNVERDLKQENGVYFQDLSHVLGKSATHCSKDRLPEDDGITQMIARTQFQLIDGPRSVWISGPPNTFKVHVHYAPIVYDNERSILKVFLKKTPKRPMIIHEEPNQTISRRLDVASNLSNESSITGVRTFAVLPSGELLLFFNRTFCYINYFNMNCHKRHTSSLIGCTD